MVKRLHFRKKPVVIEAVQVTAADYNPALPPEHQFDGSPFSLLPQWLIDAVNQGKVQPRGDDRDYAIWDILTLEGTMTAEPGDWLIKGIKGEIYPCKPDIFEATYEFVEGGINMET